jgi:hypothetical protein
MVTLVNNELSKLSSWLMANKLSLNVKKTNVMFFGCKKILNSSNQLKITMNNKCVERVSNTTFLEIILDEMLDWNLHITSVSKKISKAIGVIRKVKFKLSSDILYLLYNTLVKPHLMYCNIVWGAAVDSNLNILFKLQKKVLRLITFSMRNSHANTLFYKLKTLNIFDMYKLQIVLFVYNSRHHDCHMELKNLYNHFRFCEVQNNYGTRSVGSLLIPAFRTNIRMRCILCSGPAIWNSLPSELKSTSSVLCLKKAFSNFMINSYVTN